MRKFITFVIIVCTYSISAQINYYPFGFARSQNIPILNSNNISLQFPWIGGINSVVFSSIDLNNDGIKDLVGFEKHGNRILPFVWNTQSAQYEFAPQFSHNFPILHDWVILKDYDNDGKEDIFTYGLASIRVFKQTSSNPLQFTLVTDQLQSYYYTSNVNIFASPDDYLGIEDVDGDGDLDILNFWLLGKFVHFQKNLSIETYGNADSLIFRLADECWGEFSEAADNNIITLFTNCQTKAWDAEPERHMGSSLLAFNHNGDTLTDLLLGDVDYPDLILLTNGGTRDSALMVAQTTQFPNTTDPINLFSMPVVSFLDLNHDGINEILVAPSDPSLTKSQDLNSLWRYDYNTQNQQYELTSTSFLQDQSIDVGSGTYPILYDWNQDGLLDLFVANYGSYDSSAYVGGFLKSYYSSSIAYYQNLGTQQNPSFKIITTNFGNLKQYNLQALHPTFADLNNDGKIDLLCGNSDGKLLFFANQNIAGQLPLLSAPVSNYQNINVSNFSTPQLFDIDQDGDLDLLIGNRRGQISYYQNTTSNTNPTFSLITTTLGNVDVRNIEVSYFGYSVPQFFRHNNQTFLLCSSEQGELFLYKDIDNNLNNSFTRTYSLVETYNNAPFFIDEGIRCGAVVGDLNNDNLIDLVVGNWAGGLTYFQGTQPIPVAIAENEIEINIYPNPATDLIQIAFPYALEGTVTLYSMLGQPLYQATISNQSHQIPCHELPSGIYLIRITFGNQTITKKVIKSKD